jgi:hypothetical protein
MISTTNFDSHDEDSMTSNLLATLPATAPRVLRARLSYAGAKPALGGWDVFFNGVRLQLRLSFKERPDGSTNLNAMFRPNGVSSLPIRLVTANTGGWNSDFLGSLPPDATDLQLEALLAKVRHGLHKDVLADRLLAA